MANPKDPVPPKKPAAPPPGAKPPVSKPVTDVRAAAAGSKPPAATGKPAPAKPAPPAAKPQAAVPRWKAGHVGRPKLGQILVDLGFLEEEQLEEVMREIQERHLSFQQAVL